MIMMIGRTKLSSYKGLINGLILGLKQCFRVKKSCLRRKARKGRKAAKVKKIRGWPRPRQFSKQVRRFNFESREFLVISILTPKTTILRLKTGISGIIL